MLAHIFIIGGTGFLYYARDSPALLWAGISLISILRSIGATVAFTSIMVLINNSAGSSRLGYVNGVSQTVACAVRGVGPALGGAVWSWSLYARCEI